MQERKYMKALRFRGAIYRLAGVKDLAKLAASYLFDWIYYSHLTKEAAVEFLSKLNPREFLRKFKRTRERDSSSLISEDLVAKIAELYSQTDMAWGDFIMELTSALDNPPPGYDWVVIDGEHRLVKEGAPRKSKPPVRGEKFAGYILLSIWWRTKKATGKPSRALQSLLRKRGGIFHNSYNKADKTREYGGFVVLPKVSVEGIGLTARSLGESLLEANPDDQFQLSAVSLDKLAKEEKLDNSDRFFTHSVKSVKFNPKHTLVELVNGDAPEYKNFLSALRNAV